MQAGESAGNVRYLARGHVYGLAIWGGKLGKGNLLANIADEVRQRRCDEEPIVRKIDDGSAGRLIAYKRAPDAPNLPELHNLLFPVAKVHENAIIRDAGHPAGIFPPHYDCRAMRRFGGKRLRQTRGLCPGEESTANG
jgi:hypothetical protein